MPVLSQKSADADSKRIEVSAASRFTSAEPETAKLFLEDTVLFDQVVDGLDLLAIDPASAAGEEALKREEVGHGAPHRLGGGGAARRG